MCVHDNEKFGFKKNARKSKFSEKVCQLQKIKFKIENQFEKTPDVLLKNHSSTQNYVLFDSSLHAQKNKDTTLMLRENESVSLQQCAT